MTRSQSRSAPVLLAPERLAEIFRVWTEGDNTKVAPICELREHIEALTRPIACSERMPTGREYVLMWETPSLRWSVGCWVPEYQQWGNRDDTEYAIHPHQVSHWMPLPEPVR